MRHSPQLSWQVPVTQKPSAQSTSVVQLFRRQVPETQLKVAGQGAAALQVVGWQCLFTQVVPVPQGLVTLQPGAQSV